MSIYTYLRKIIYPHNIVIDHIPNNANILDIGCGNNNLLLDSIKNHINSYTGIDPKIKKNLYSKNIKITNDSIEKIIDKIQNYNCIIMIDVMHHIKKNEQEKIIKKIINSMKKNSIFVYKDISNRNIVFSFMNRLHDLIYNFENINYFDSKKIISHINEEKNSYNHFYKRILWFDHEFLIIKSKN